MGHGPWPWAKAWPWGAGPGRAGLRHIGARGPPEGGGGAGCVLGRKYK